MMMKRRKLSIAIAPDVPAAAEPGAGQNRHHGDRLAPSPHGGGPDQRQPDDPLRSSPAPLRPRPIAQHRALQPHTFEGPALALGESRDQLHVGGAGMGHRPGAGVQGPADPPLILKSLVNERVGHSHGPELKQTCGERSAFLFRRAASNPRLFRSRDSGCAPNPAGTRGASRGLRRFRE
ncbi:hypothetical protein SKAU_G00010960 [Synaphobranchus kaupii]|uniref:Uncharacterized protein n=1 Tax=Synaphobranchus kaupii TaxID=118154 RepID=A0A9Q1GAZ6_SYNKA|nr:hypothetical protein SKAU_G00010960 [Synaphobranchus kaupii]